MAETHSTEVFGAVQGVGVRPHDDVSFGVGPSPPVADALGSRSTQCRAELGTAAEDRPAPGSAMRDG